jgi:hypothetical protein
MSDPSWRRAREQWNPVVGYETIYDVSNQGRVRRKTNGHGVRKGRILQGTIIITGYCQVTLFRNKQSKVALIHALVGQAFLGLRPCGHEINHKNGIKTDNRPDNLEWVTKRENALHSHHVLGLSDHLSRLFTGEGSSSAKLTWEKVRRIRRLWQTDRFRYCDLAERFNVARGTIRDILCGITWRGKEIENG